MKLVEYIKQNYSPEFNPSNLPFKIAQKKVKKGTIVIPYFKECSKIYFLNEGIVETTISHREIEKTLAFNFKNSFFSGMSSFMTKSPSIIQSTAITDCVIEEYSYQEYQKICETSLLFNIIGRVELEKAYLKKIQREKDLLTKTAEEMYLDLIEKNPEILQNIPLKKIANYFGILPETLSRIRKRIIS